MVHSGLFWVPKGGEGSQAGGVLLTVTAAGSSTYLIPFGTQGIRSMSPDD